jgi:dephospho-CoA kinase
VFNGKPIIGLAGGIGSGKSFVAKLFEELGCVVINSDDLAHEAHGDPVVRQAFRSWWGQGVFKADGSVDRRAVAKIVFADPAERARLEALLHPLIDRLRIEKMRSAGNSALAFVWDSPLLFETGLDARCDATVFVDAPEAVRVNRVTPRGWDAGELARREKNQWPLDKKRAIADYVVDNTADAGQTRGQVSRLLSRILSSCVEETARDDRDGHGSGR